MEWPTFRPGRQATHDLAMVVRLVAQDLTVLLRQVPSSAREDVRGHAFALRCAYLSLHGIRVEDLADAGEVSSVVEQRAARVFEECPACRTWRADIFEQLNLRRLRDDPTE
jgi:hypothetical protein